MTDAERILWRQLRAHRMLGRKFRRQQPVGPYIVDFVHFGARLIVECDGGQHNESAADQRRDTWLRAQGFTVLRYWNHQILNETDHVLEDILNSLPPLPQPLSHEGRGEQPKPRYPGKPASSPSPLAGEGLGRGGSQPRETYP
ncbi:endonuclease domain-containing protein [Arhodomonas sp. KWT2]|nr:endonuclease domain-containing protein [Arhodomonas sp. KWT]